MTNPSPKELDRTIWKIAGPAILANSASPLVGLVDTAIVGHLPGPTHLAAVGVGVTIFNFIAWSLGFLRMAATGLLAQSFGAGDSRAVHGHLLRAASTGFTTGLLLLMAAPLFLPMTLDYFASSDEVRLLSRAYIDIRLYSMPAALLGMAVTAFFIATGRTYISLILQLILNGTNLAANLILVLGFGLGVRGLAIGSVIAEWTLLVAALIALSRFVDMRGVAAAARQSLTWRISKFLAFGRVSGFLFLRTLLMVAAYAWHTRQASQLGDVALASSQILMTFSLLVALGLDGFAYTAEALVGQAVGRKNKAETHYAALRTGLWALMLSMLYTAVFAAFFGDIVALLTDIESIRTAMEPLYWLIIVTPVIAVASYHYDGVYIGAVAPGGMFTTMAVALALYFAAVPLLRDPYGLAGLWGAMLIFLASRGVGQALLYPWMVNRSLNR